MDYFSLHTYHKVHRYKGWRLFFSWEVIVNGRLALEFLFALTADNKSHLAMVGCGPGGLEVPTAFMCFSLIYFVAYSLEDKPRIG